jgi:hypothetical protein
MIHRLVTTPFRAALVVAVCSVVACGESTAPVESVPSVEELLDDMNVVATLGGSAMTFLGVTAPLSMPAPGPCPYESATQRFVCPATIAGSFTVKQYVQLFDASNTPMSTYDVSKLAAIRHVSDVTGTTVSGTSSFKTTQHNDGTLSGLLTGTRTLNASGTHVMTVTSTQLPSSVVFDMSHTTTNVVVPKRGNDNKYPPSGTIAMTLLVGPPNESTATSTITMTFNGTSIVPMTFTTNGVTRTCTVDLASATAQPLCQ